MEPSFLYTFVFFLASFIICLKRFILPSRNSKTTPKLPPGNIGLPIIGETLQFSIMGQKGTPEKFFLDRMSKHSDQVFKTSLIGLKTAVFCGVSGNKFLFSNENKLVAVSWPSTAKKVFPHSGKTTATVRETSMRLRRIFNRVFHPEALQQKWVGVVDVVAKKHLENHWWNAEKDQVSALSVVRQFVVTVSCKLFLNVEDFDDMKDLADQMEVLVAGIYSIPINFPGTSCNRGIKAANSIRKKLLGILRRRKNDLMMKSTSSDHADYLSCSLTARDDNGELNEEEIIDHVLALLLASRDSTISAITSTIKYLADYPHIYDQVFKEQRSIAEEKAAGELLNWKDLQKMKYSWNVVSEVMRLMPPMQGNFREALSDFHYSSFFIPKGWKLYWSPNTTHKNAEYFSEPEKFDPSRFERACPNPYAYVPFGGGSRICPGKDMARVIILTFVYNLVGSFRWEKLIPDENVIVLPVPMPAQGLPIRLYPN